jgi:Ni,Fe-hydrogenase maturation factor
VIFIDASADAAPGEVVERAIQPSGVRARFTHHSTPEALLAGARALYGRAPEATVITIGGADFSLSSGLSPVVQSAIDRVISTTLNLLAHKS